MVCGHLTKRIVPQVKRITYKQANKFDVVFCIRHNSGMATKIKPASEHSEQVSLIRWARLAAQTRPALAGLVAIPNGGARHIAVATKLKAEGVSKGYPDLALNVPRGGFAGLFIELKAMDGRTSPEQKDWISRLNAQGNYAAVCKGWTAARELIEAYLDEKLRGEPGSSLKA